MNKLGFTFYPKDWWTSDSFYTLSPFERYIYLELLFMMYDNGGFIKNNKAIVERRLGTQIDNVVWDNVSDLLVKEGGLLTHQSVNKRLNKSIVAKENGKKGGRPPKNVDTVPTNKDGNENSTSLDQTNTTPKSQKLIMLTPGEMIQLTPLDKCQFNYFNSTNYQKAKETLCMNLRVDISKLKLCSIAFNNSLESVGEATKTLKDWSSHFRNWLMKQDVQEAIEAGMKIFKGESIKAQISNEPVKAEISEEKRQRIAQLRNDVG